MSKSSYQKLKEEYEELKRKFYVLLDNPDSEEAELLRKLRKNYTSILNRFIGEIIRPEDWTVKTHKD